MLPSHSILTPAPAPPVPNFVHLDSQYSVCSQLQPQHLMEAAAAGFTMIVNNRPDAELLASDGVQQQQPTSDVMQRAAHSLGLRYLWLLQKEKETGFKRTGKLTPTKPSLGLRYSGVAIFRRCEGCDCQRVVGASTCASRLKTVKFGSQSSFVVINITKTWF